MNLMKMVQGLSVVVIGLSGFIIATGWLHDAIAVFGWVAVIFSQTGLIFANESMKIMDKRLMVYRKRLAELGETWMA